MERRLNFVSLIVSDLGRARRFYLDDLGWKADAAGARLCVLHNPTPIGVTIP